MVRGSDGCTTAFRRGEAAVTVEGASSTTRLPLGGVFMFAFAVVMMLGSVLVLDI